MLGPLKLKEAAYRALDGIASLVHGSKATADDAPSRALTEELRTSIATLPPLRDRQEGSTEDRWLEWVREFRQHLLNDDPREFTRWPVVRRTMFVSNAATSLREWKALKRSPQWPRWQPVLREDAPGRPAPFIFSGRTSGNQIHHTYHLAEFERRTGRRVHDFGLVFEFGGGYGSMCRQIYKAGFSGKYVVFDLPELLALQCYFLKSVSVPVLAAEQWSEPGAKGVLLISDLAALRLALQGAGASSAGPALFVATWSLSESPAPLREQILPLTASFQAYLIAYQVRFGTVENTDFFAAFAGKAPNVRWHNYEITGMKGNWYLMGSVD